MTVIDIDNLEDIAPTLDRRAQLTDNNNDNAVVFDGSALACAIKVACKSWDGLTDEEKEILDEAAETMEVPVDHAGLFVAVTAAYSAVWGADIMESIVAGRSGIAHDALVYDDWIKVCDHVKNALCDADPSHVMCDINHEQFNEVSARLMKGKHFTKLS